MRVIKRFIVELESKRFFCRGLFAVETLVAVSGRSGKLWQKLKKLLFGMMKWKFYVHRFKEFAYNYLL